MTVIQLFVSLFQAALTFLFNLEISEGVSVGWIFIVVVIMFILIRFFLKGDKNG